MGVVDGGNYVLSQHVVIALLPNQLSVGSVAIVKGFGPCLHQRSIHDAHLRYALQIPARVSSGFSTSFASRDVEYIR